jgi:hypothetical protein
VESTHGTPPAAGIASFRSATTKNNILSNHKVVKWFFSGGSSLCVDHLFYSDCFVFIKNDGEEFYFLIVIPA